MKIEYWGYYLQALLYKMDIFHTMKVKKDDTLWKGILEDIFDNFLLFIFGQKADIFDFTKEFEFLNKELAQIYPVDENAAYPKYVDKLVKVFTKNGREEWVLVHVEVQGYEDPNFAKRMFTYFYRILDKFGKQVTCVVIYTGSEKVSQVQQYDYSFLGTENHFKFNVYSIVDQDFEQLSKNENPFALIVQTVLIALQKSRLGESELIKLYKDIARRLLEKNISPVKTRAIMNFLKYYVSFENRENVIKFEKEIKVLTNNNFTMGIEELLLDRAEKRGIEKGREAGKEESAYLFVKKLLRDTDFDDEKIASLASVDVPFVQQIRAELGL
jgi:predicted transposase/invertase (TIGR01784 family)